MTPPVQVLMSQLGYWSKKIKNKLKKIYIYIYAHSLLPQQLVLDTFRTVRGVRRHDQRGWRQRRQWLAGPAALIARARVYVWAVADREMRWARPPTHGESTQPPQPPRKEVFIVSSHPERLTRFFCGSPYSSSSMRFFFLFSTCQLRSRSSYSAINW